jgi:transposase-like protein
VASRQTKNRARREWWSVHIEAWQRSGLSRKIYCRQHRLTEKTFGRWLRAIEGVEALRAKAELAREARRNKAPRWSSDARSRAVQAFWAMHVEALTWSGLSFAAYASALRLPEKSLRRWRERLETGEVEIDWRARLHPSALPQLSTSAKAGAKDNGLERSLTRLASASRRTFTAAEKLTIVLEVESPGETVSSVARRHGIVTSMLFRWRVQFGYGDKARARLASVKLADGGRQAATLQGLLPVPDGMAAVDLPDGRRVFAPVGADPEAVRRQVLDREAGR